MEWQCAERVVKMDYFLLVVFQADLIRAFYLEWRVPFQRSGKVKRNEKSKVGIVSKTFVKKRFSRNGAFPARPAGGREMQGNVLEWLTSRCS